MQLARLSIFADTSIIVNAIGCVGILLHLCQKNPLADCVQGARLNKEQIAFFYWNTVDNLHQRSICNPAAELLLADLSPKAIDQLSAFLRIENIPRLRFAKFLLDAARIGVVRMHLNRQVILCIDEFDQDREISKLLRMCSKAGSPHLLNGLRQRQPLIPPVFNQILALRVAGEHPCLR